MPGGVAINVGNPQAQEQGAQHVCDALGKLVAAGVMPVLEKACRSQSSSLQLFPAVSRETSPAHLCCRQRSPNRDVDAAGAAVPLCA